MSALPKRPAIRSGMSTRLLAQKVSVGPFRAPGVTMTRHIGRAVVWMTVDGRTMVATAKRIKTAGRPVTYLLRVPGYQWDVTPDMPAARIWRDGSKILVKGFPTWQACDREVARILKERTAP